MSAVAIQPSATLERFALIECLACGQQRLADIGGTASAGDCPRCGYVGWAPAADLDEVIRRQLREEPLTDRGWQR